MTHERSIGSFCVGYGVSFSDPNPGRGGEDAQIEINDLDLGSGAFPSKLHHDETEDAYENDFETGTGMWKV